MTDARIFSDLKIPRRLWCGPFSLRTKDFENCYPDNILNVPLHVHHVAHLNVQSADADLKLHVLSY